MQRLVHGRALARADMYGNMPHSQESQAAEAAGIVIAWLVQGLPLELRLWSKVRGPWADPNIGADDCWIWIGAQAPQERPKAFRKTARPYRVYGRIRDGERRLIGPHRAALIVSKGAPSDESLLACHTCDTPLCCNPRHLFWGNDAGNTQDAFNKGRITRLNGRFAEAA